MELEHSCIETNDINLHVVQAGSQSWNPCPDAARLSRNLALLDPPNPLLLWRQDAGSSSQTSAAIT